MTDPMYLKREQRGESREERDYNLLSNWLRFFTELLPPHSSLLSLLGNTKRVSHCEQPQVAWQSHIDYSQFTRCHCEHLKGAWQSHYSLFTFGLKFMTDPTYATPHRFALRGDDFVVGLKFMTDPR